MREENWETYKLRSINHRCHNHLWTTYALVESPSRQLDLGGIADRLGGCLRHDGRVEEGFLYTREDIRERGEDAPRHVSAD